MVRMDKEIPMAKRMDRVNEVLKQVTSPVYFYISQGYLNYTKGYVVGVGEWLLEKKKNKG